MLGSNDTGEAVTSMGGDAVGATPNRLGRRPPWLAIAPSHCKVTGGEGEADGEPGYERLVRLPIRSGCAESWKLGRPLNENEGVVRKAPERAPSPACVPAPHQESVRGSTWCHKEGVHAGRSHKEGRVPWCQVRATAVYLNHAWHAGRPHSIIRMRREGIRPRNT